MAFTSSLEHFRPTKLILLSFFLCLSAYVAFSVFYQIIHYRFYHPLSKVPGPFWASVTRLWHAYHCLKGDEHCLLLELHKQYGPILRVTPTMLAVSDPTKIPDIYHRQADKSSFFISGSLGEVEATFNIQDWKQHSYHRKLIAGPYSFTNIKKMEPLVDIRINAWIKRIDELFAQTRKRFDFAPWAVYLTFDVVSDIGFGAPFGFVATGTDVSSLIKNLLDAFPAFGVLSRLYPFTAWVKTTWVGERFLVARPEHKNGIGAIMRFRDRLIKQRVEEIKGGKHTRRVDLLQAFLDARTDDGAPLDIEYVKAEALIVLLAGAETTGTAINTTVSHITSTPRIYIRVMREIDTAVRAGHLSSPPQYDEVLQHCPYYVACVKESLRLYPPANGLNPRLVRNGGMELGGYFVPEGMEVACAAWTLHRNEETYGPDADVYRPERWLEDEEKAKLYGKYNFAFGYGSRGCLGKDLATMELYKGSIQFLRTFRIELVDGEKRPNLTAMGGGSWWKDIWMEIERREKTT